MPAAAPRADAAPWLIALRAGVPARWLRHHPGPTPLIERLHAEIDRLESAPAAALRQALQHPDPARLEADLDWCAQPGHRLLHWAEADYPERLRAIAQAPPLLFCQGDASLLSWPQLAIVGARRASAQGLIEARRFAAALAGRGLAITSGLALGIDGAAHEGALEAQGLTVAVCATGLDEVYPRRHQKLAARIRDQGLLVSEFPPGTPPRADHFPRRNRLISGLSLGVLVVEAMRASGSLITARLALEQGREVFAIPGSIHQPLAQGCHQLIREGAKLTETIEDILEEIAAQLPAAPQAAAPAPAPDRAPASADPLLAWLGEAPCTVDELAARSGLAPAVLAERLLALELAGLVAEDGQGRLLRLHRR